MEIRIFATAQDREADRKFVDWQLENPNGYILNRKTSARGMIHQVGCFHIGAPGEWDPDWGDLTDKPKICSARRNAVEEWAHRQGVSFTECAHCIQ